ncbi:lymphocyte cytosolic protein 2-like isoform X1 [Xenia sp. Carnegie-2017]|uniref:lymphocyte cytosolic protein 2-like isoform X1 n=1 Tax=Xenia sp. Carnegie-2017 TaxID=2897299 RepID=UPI001F03B01B|nr:lymphocyte cytosolic protein 2-like isoform X1 [Xenia sp. Carnegie-2017]
MPIPSRSEVLSWKENEVADLLREQNLLDCIDSIYQRHIDGQKLLNLQWGDVRYFLEIQNSHSRRNFWDVVSQIQEKRERNGGVQNLMKRFQGNSQISNEEEGQEESDFDDSDDSFDDDYDLPDEDEPQLSLERRETIRQNLMRGMMTDHNAVNSGDGVNYTDGDDGDNGDEIYDMPENYDAEPEDLYDDPNGESGEVHSHSAFDLEERGPIVFPDDTTTNEVTDDYEIFDAATSTDAEPLDDYVVPDPAPPRPPKPDHPVNKVLSERQWPPPAKEKSNLISNLKSRFEEQQENYEAPEPPRALKKPTASPVIPQDPPVPRSARQPKQKVPKTAKNKLKDKPIIPTPPQDTYEPPTPPRPPSKLNQKKLPNFTPQVEIEESYIAPDAPARPQKSSPFRRKPIPEPEEEYIAPDAPAKPTKNWPPSNNFNLHEDENYIAPEAPTRPVTTPIHTEEDYIAPEAPERPRKSSPFSRKPIPPIEPEEDYIAPDAPSRPNKRSVPPIPLEENYEPPETHRDNKPNMAEDDGEEEYEVPDNLTGAKTEEPEDYEVPETPSKKDPETLPKKDAGATSGKKNIFNMMKKLNPSSIFIDNKKKGIKPQPPPPSTVSQHNALNPVDSVGSNNQRHSQALPDLPSDGSNGRRSPSLPPKPRNTDPPTPKKKPALPVSKPPKEPLPRPKNKPVPLPVILSPSKTKRQQLEDQPWFHGSISKNEIAEKLKGARKDGSYLVRVSSRDQSKCIMSILYKNEIRHLDIPCGENNQYRLGNSGSEKFKSIEELVSYFTRNEVEFSAGGRTRLTNACV